MGVSPAWDVRRSARACVSAIWACVSLRLLAMNARVSGSRPVIAGVVSIVSSAIAFARAAASSGLDAETLISTRLLSVGALADTFLSRSSGSMSSLSRWITRTIVARCVATAAYVCDRRWPRRVWSSVGVTVPVALPTMRVACAAYVFGQTRLSAIAVTTVTTRAATTIR